MTNTSIILRSLPLLAALALTTVGCISEKFAECPAEDITPTREVLYLRVMDLATQTDITDQQMVRDAAVYIFDENRNFLQEVNLSAASAVDDDIPISLAGYEGSKIYVSAWGNTASGVDMDNASAGVAMNASVFELIHLDTGFCMCPGELFFGMQEIDLTSTNPVRNTTERRTRVDITQKNARLMITVKRLPEDVGAEEYYFRLCNQNSGYDYMGNSTPDSDEIRETGIFDSNHNLISPQPYYLIHSVDPDNIDGASCMTLHLMRKGATRADDVDLTGPITIDADGKHIALYQGLTTNVMLDMGTDPTAWVEITPWDKIFQWNQW